MTSMDQTTQQYDIIIIGFGKAGKTFAKAASKQGKKVAAVERSAAMYGGTCINIACIPSKTMVMASNQGLSFDDAMARKHSVVTALNGKNYHMLADDENIDVIDGVARFASNNVVDVFASDESDESDAAAADPAHAQKPLRTLTAERIIINTGATSIVPDIPGLRDSRYMLTSTEALDLEHMPKRTVIIGGGYIALEFASMLNTFGSEVTVLERSEKLMPREDAEIAAQAVADLKAAGIHFELGVDTLSVEDGESTVTVHTSAGDFEGEAVLVATGRRPRTEGLGLENTDIRTGERGEVLVNEKLETTAPGVYAVGDVKGGLQFTYISLDDFRILRSQFFGQGERTTANRGHIPYSVFITPTLSRVGLTFAQAQERGLDVVENAVPVNTIPRHKINNDPRGLFKVVVDRSTKEIVGASLYGAQSEELINYLKMAMDNHIPYTYVRDAIFTHPTMSESFNDLLNI
ncbi:hypothiocyanous acid reductase MerA [Alloscardovia macacae]|uniref:Dihydrolipoamide dehydrogenase n=1 Tax=Alloscardovia macacae TaxID=1160091 RepID=A0A261F560_9BIFI|nr:hypothiocyanous acid reductase MerA [Alloscardovia macacae]OZG54244.1 dihydrolipoamide dehydrogenase [Alloscardovia macacae]